MHVRRLDGAIEIETSRLRARVELDRLSLALASLDGRTRVAGARPAVDVGGILLFASRALLDGYGEVRSRSGLATRVEVRATAEPALELRLQLDIAEDWPGIVAELSASNRGAHPVAIRRILPWHLDTGDGGDLTLPFDPHELRFLRMGYQSWTPAGYVPLRAREPHPRLAFVKRMHQGPFTPPPRRDLHVSDFMSSLRSPTEPGLTIGFLTHHRFLTYVTLGHSNGSVRSLEASTATEGRELAPGETLRSERLWIGIDEPDSDGMAEWAERTGREMGVSIPPHVGTGWCSWYQFFTRVTSADVARNVEALAPLRGQIETVQIDDGFQAVVGDWLEWDPGFPEGLAPIGAKILSSGFRAGIWLAPFMVSRASRVAREHPDWLLRSRRGRPIIANVNPAWKGTLCYALDPTRPEVGEWLSEVVTTLRSWGFDYLKLDFLYAGALVGERHDPRKPIAAAYREVIAKIREAAAPDPFLIGCGAPLGPSIGLFEAMRIGPDIAPKWRSRAEDAAAGLPAAPSARNALRNVLARAPLHNRLWINDPDCVLLRDQRTRLSGEEVRTIASAAFMSGGLLLLSDDLKNLSDDRRGWLERLLPPIGRAPRTGPPRGEVPNTLVQALPDGTVLWLGVNLDEKPRSEELVLGCLGLEGRIHVYDVWNETYGGTHTGLLRLEPIPPHGCRLLRLAPADGRARVVGSTLHLSAGTAEVARIRQAAEGERSPRALVALRIPGARQGRVLVDPGTGEPVSVHVRFEGELELLVSGLQIQDPGADRSEEG